VSGGGGEETSRRREALGDREHGVVALTTGAAAMCLRIVVVCVAETPLACRDINVFRRRSKATTCCPPGGRVNCCRRVLPVTTPRREYLPMHA